MMKTLRLALAFIAGMSAVSAFPQAGSAQFYERVLPIDEIIYAVEEHGFEPISRPQLRGDVYIVEVIDLRGRRARLSVDAFDGDIIGSVRQRTVGPAPIYREAFPVQPFAGRGPALRGEGLRVFPDGRVRDLRDPSTRGLTDRGSSVRIQRVPVPPESARAAPDLPIRAPLPPFRPQELAVAPDAGDAFSGDAGSTIRPARRLAPESGEPSSGVPSSGPSPVPPAEMSERQRSVIERTTPVVRSTPLRADAGTDTRSVRIEREIERVPTPRGEALLDEFGPDEIDQMDLYLPPPPAR